ncbi:MAG: sigma-70 family RNA polymerase sigma factor [Bacteroidota bacterium]
MNTQAEHTTAVWNTFRKTLYAFILKRVKDPEMTKDILQEVFVKVHLKAGDISSEKKLPAWVFTVARNAIIDEFRKQKRHDSSLQSLTQLDLENEETAPPPCCEACLDPFLNQLPDRYREAIEATDLGELSQKEYAEQVHVSYSTIKSRVQRGREKLNELFQNCCAPCHTDAQLRTIEACSCPR